jgi:hypothetical protein
MIFYYRYTIINYRVSKEDLSMTHSHDAPPRLRRIATWMCIVIPTVAALTTLMVVGVWLSPHAASLLVPRLGLAGLPTSLDLSTRIAGLFVSAVPVFVLLYALHQSYKLFDAFRHGDAITSNAALCLRRIGLSMIVIAALRPIIGAILSLLLTLANPPGGRHIVIGISSDDYMIATFAGLVIAIGYVMTEAARLAEDNKQIV